MLRAILVGLIPAALAILANCTDRVDREAIFHAYVDAVNRNAVEDALSFHTENAEFIIPGQQPIRGKEAMRALLQWDSVLQSSLVFGAAEEEGDTLTVSSGSERISWFSGIGLDSIAYGPGLRIIFDGPLIRGVYPSALVPSSAAEFEARVGLFMGWAAQEAQEDLGQLMPNGLFRYDAESATAWLDVLARYQAAGSLLP